MLSALIPSERGQPAVPLARQLAHQRFVRPGPLVLGAAPIKSPTPTEDRDRTVSRRSKPSSRASLTGEQPDPWDLLQPQDETTRPSSGRSNPSSRPSLRGDPPALWDLPHPREERSRHRGAKPCRRYELLG